LAQKSKGRISVYKYVLYAQLLKCLHTAIEMKKNCVYY